MRDVNVFWFTKILNLLTLSIAVFNYFRFVFPQIDVYKHAAMVNV